VGHRLNSVQIEYFQLGGLKKKRDEFEEPLAVGGARDLGAGIPIFFA
jgi:hypothetical protein